MIHVVFLFRAKLSIRRVSILISQLKGAENLNVHFCIADSTSFVDDTDAEFRSRVEEIRQIGGDSWLKIFGEIQGEEEMTQVCASFILSQGDANSLVKCGRFFLPRTVQN